MRRYRQLIPFGRAMLAALLIALSAHDCWGAEAVRLFVTHFGGNDISVIDPVTGKLIATIETGYKPRGVGIDPDGELAVGSNTGSGDVTIIDVSARKAVATVPVGKSAKRLAVGTVETKAE